MAAMIELRGITKRFPGVLALNRVDLSAEAGDVLALVGENGAGKSTLIKIISGLYQQDEGTILMDGKDISRFTPAKSIEAGIAVIYQELSYMPYMSIAENIFLGSQPRKKGMIDYKALREKSKEIQKEVGLEHRNPFSRVSELSTAEKQLLEIARAYVRNVRVFILDEPTSALNDAETKLLFRIIRKMQKEGKAVIYISHKLDEIFAVCNKIQIMRDGETVYRAMVRDITKEQIISHMVGRTIRDMYPIGKRQFGEILLSVSHLSTEKLEDINIHVRQREIVGIYGLMGAGSEDVLEALFGLKRLTEGEIRIRGKDVRLSSPIQAIRSGFAYTPGERKTEGVMLNQTVCSNISVVTLGNYRRGPFLSPPKEKKMVEEWVDTLKIKTPSIQTRAVSLSGGNQQKVILARWLNNRPDIFLMNEPTKGIDVGAKVEIYKEMERICENDGAVLFVTSDMLELMGVCDRVYVMHEGRIAAEYEKADMTQENIVKSAIGE